MAPGLDSLQGGGELGAQLRAFDWSRTLLGPVERWPQSLRTAASICLGSRFPMLVLWGPDYVALYNDGYAPMLGAKHPSAIGRPLRETWPEVWNVIGPMLDGVRSSGVATWSADQRLILERNGFPEEGFFSYSFGPARGEDGTVDGIFTAVIETTARIVGERRLVLLNRLAERTILAANADEACVLAADAMDGSADLPFAAIYLNGDGEQGRLVARTAGAPDLPASVTAPDEALPRDRPVLAVPIASAGQDRTLGLLVAGLNPHRALDADYRSFLGLVAGHIAAAVTDARMLEAERARAEALAELDRAKTTFFSNISHEFRTPLTLIAGPIADLIATAGPDDRERLLLVQRNVQRLLKLVNALLDFSRIEAGRMDAAFVPTDVGTLTAELASAFQSVVERAGLRFVVEAPPLPQEIYLDRDLWEKVILNLLSNAVKFTAAGEIAVRVEPTTTGARVIVSDTGTGIAEEHLPRIFERFYRVSNPLGRTQEGAGIGLAFAHEIVRLHGSTIQVRSRVGEGTTFTVDLLAGREHLPAHQIAEGGTASLAATDTFVDEIERWAQPAATVSSHSDGRAHVLVAEDNADMRRYVERTLAARWRVSTCVDGASAIQLAREQRPDLLITDVMMPGLSGFEVLATLRADPELRGLPVIMLSARAGDEAVVEGLEAGADDYLVKPFSSRELVARVGTQLELHRLRRQAEEANRSKDDFLAMLGHELRNPLAPIMTALQLMRLRAGDVAVKEREVIERQTAILVRLVDDLLDVARVMRGKITLQLEPLEISEIVAKALETASPSIARHGHRLEVEVPDTGCVVEGDAGRLTQVVANLLTNAAKYTPTGGLIEVTARRDNGDVVLSVKDTGIGLSAEMLPRVFDLFAQDHHAVDRAAGGLGLGLAIARNLVHLHGGTIDAYSEGRGRGSEFLVRLPAR